MRGGGFATRGEGLVSDVARFASCVSDFAIRVSAFAFCAAAFASRHARRRHNRAWGRHSIRHGAILPCQSARAMAKAHDSTAELIVLSQTALGHSQKQLAELCGVSHTTAHRWVAGGSSPSASDLHRLADARYAGDPWPAARPAAHHTAQRQRALPTGA